MVPLLLANDGVGSLDRNPRWGSHSVMTPLFLGWNTPDVTRRTPKVHSLCWILPNAVMFIMFLIRLFHLFLVTNRHCGYLHCPYTQGDGAPTHLSWKPRCLSKAGKSSSGARHLRELERSQVHISDGQRPDYDSASRARAVIKIPFRFNH